MKHIILLTFYIFYFATFIHCQKEIPADTINRIEENPTAENESVMVLNSSIDTNGTTDTEVSLDVDHDSKSIARKGVDMSDATESVPVQEPDVGNFDHTKSQIKGRKGVDLPGNKTKELLKNTNTNHNNDLMISSRPNNSTSIKNPPLEAGKKESTSVKKELKDDDIEENINGEKLRPKLVGSTGDKNDNSVIKISGVRKPKKGIETSMTESVEESDDSKESAEEIDVEGKVKHETNSIVSEKKDVKGSGKSEVLEKDHKTTTSTTTPAPHMTTKISQISPTPVKQTPSELNSESTPKSVSSSVLTWVISSIVLILVCWIVFFIYRRFKGGWGRRRYERVDFLIDGMYDDL